MMAHTKPGGRVHSTLGGNSAVHDELENLAFTEIVKRRRFGGSQSALVVPAGKGDLALEMARLGSQVTAADNAGSCGELERRALSSGLKDEVRVVVATLDDLQTLPTDPYDIVFCRRGLCSLPYEEACRTVRNLLLRLRIGGKLFLSVLGLHSELGEGYGGRDQMTKQRFAPLAPQMATKYNIDAPVCLYSERDLFLLMLESGASVLRTFTTTHGNVKGVAVRV